MYPFYNGTFTKGMDNLRSCGKINKIPLSFRRLLNEVIYQEIDQFMSSLESPLGQIQLTLEKRRRGGFKHMLTVVVFVLFF